MNPEKGPARAAPHRSFAEMISKLEIKPQRSITAPLPKEKSMITGLTKKQAKALQYVTEFIAANGGRSPTYSQIARGAGLCNAQSAHGTMERLEKRGLLRLGKTIEIFNQAARKPAAPKRVSMETVDEMRKRIAATQPTPRAKAALEGLSVREAVVAVFDEIEDARNRGVSWKTLATDLADLGVTSHKTLEKYHMAERRSRGLYHYPKKSA